MTPIGGDWTLLPLNTGDTLLDLLLGSATCATTFGVGGYGIGLSSNTGDILLDLLLESAACGTTIGGLTL
jgi:hypothetical protein